jgi:oxygen-dependent protoporphyrinogen oxidase
LSRVDDSFERVLEGIAYAPVAIVSLGYRKSDVGHTMEGFGFLVSRSAGLDSLGSVWNSSLFPNRAPDGHMLLTSFVGEQQICKASHAVHRSSSHLSTGKLRQC